MCVCVPHKLSCPEGTTNLHIEYKVAKYYMYRCSMQCLLSVFIIYSSISYTRVDSQKFLTQQKLYIYLWKQK